MITTGAISISQALMVNQTLLELCISGNQITDDGITAIAGSLSNSSITLLNVLRCGISVVGARLIMKAAVDSAVCKDVWIDGEYDDDDEVKRMRSILDDRSRQDVRINYMFMINYYCHDNRQVMKTPVKMMIVLKRSH